MTIKIRFHGDKAIIRWKSAGEAMFLKQQLTMFRDSMSKNTPISVKDEKGREVPKILLPRPPPLVQQAPGPINTDPVIAGRVVAVPGDKLFLSMNDPISGGPPIASVQPVTIVVNPKPSEGGEIASQK